ncbi:kinase-like domain-containing protein [Trichophaea hybrida]|nr:kinase-like domain-containing protein [Trichophaea hybrida]
MRRLDHPNIVKLIDFKEEKAYYYLILELCPGGELFHQIVRLTYFSEDLSRHVITQVAGALKYLHEEKGIVHRDIKPENLLFYPTPFIPTRNPKPKSAEDEDKVDEGEFVPGVGSGGIGQIKIADFGLSKVIWEDTTVTPCGTVGYTAPEIVKDERYSKSVDMWALGCVLYTLLCGFPPFYDESISALTEKVARGQYTFLSPWWDDISKSAQDLVSHLLTVNPEQRYDIKQFLEHPWIKNTKEPTQAASDAPPLATPSIAKEGLHFIDESPGMAMETPGGGRRMDFRSPGAVSLREVFDVGYAVHRMEEENKRRKNWKQGYRGSNTAPLNEEDEEEEDEEDDDEVSVKIPKDGESENVSAVEQKLRRTNLNASAHLPAAGTAVPAGASAYSTHVASARAPPAAQKKFIPGSTKTGVHKKRGFELSLDNATLLGRRKRGGEETVAG